MRDLNLSEEEKVKFRKVYNFVVEERERMGVTKDQIGSKRRFENSCYSHGQKSGEFKNLLYRQLIYTKKGYGCWGELSGNVLGELLKYIRNIKEYREKQ